MSIRRVGSINGLRKIEQARIDIRQDRNEVASLTLRFKFPAHASTLKLPTSRRVLFKAEGPWPRRLDTQCRAVIELLKT